MSKQKQKEPLSLMIARTALAIAVITGIGTIIFGGGVVIMKYYNSEVNNRTAKPVDQDELRICNKDSDCYEYSPCGMMGFSCFNKTGYEISVRNNVNISCPHVEIMPWQSYRYNKEKCACSEGNCVKVFSKERYCKSLENSFKWCGENKPFKYPYNPEESECLEIEDLFNENCISEKNIKNDTSDWQTYRNEEFGFEVKYPEDFRMYETEVTYGQNAGYVVGFMEIGSERLHGIGIKIFRINQDETAEEAFDRIYKVDLTNITKDEKTIAGIKAEYYKNMPGHNSYDEAFFVYDDYFYGISKHTIKEETFDQVISTFKFIEK